MPISSTTKKIIQAGEAGGAVLRKYFGKVLEQTQKSTASDFFTQADINSERAVIKSLHQNFPKYNIFSEEAGLLDQGSEWTFVIDPLDGTNNFVLGIPNFSVSIALQKGEKTTHGVVYQPILQQTYCAEINQGAYLNNYKMSVNDTKDIHRATVAYACGYIISFKHEVPATKRIHSLGVKRLLTSWSPAMDFCLLASGKIEAMVNDRDEIYDFLAGKLIAQEAGAIISDFAGKKITDDTIPTFILSNNQTIKQALVSVLAKK